MKVITNIKHLVLAFAVMAIGSLFAGPRVTIIGDSISTFSGSTGPGYETHYPANDVTSVEQTWWKQVITAIGGELAANAAWSGSHVAASLSDNSDSVPEKAMSSDYRLVKSKLGGDNVDVFMILAGTNDARGHFLNTDDPNNKPIGEFDATTFNAAEADRRYFAPAFAYMVNYLHVNYPNAQIWIIINCNVDDELAKTGPVAFTDATDWTPYADVMKSVAAAYDAHVVELTGLDGNKKYSETFANSASGTTKVHPTAAGMTAIANQVSAAYLAVNPKSEPEQPVNPSYAGGSLSITEKNNVLSIGIPAGLVEEGTKGAGLILAYDSEDKGDNLDAWAHQYVPAGVEITPASQVVKIPRKELPAAIQVGMILKAFVTRPKAGYGDYTFYESVTRGTGKVAYFLLDYYTNPDTRTIADIEFSGNYSGSGVVFMGGIQNNGGTPRVNYSLSFGDKDNFRLWLYHQGGDYGGVAQNTSVGAVVIQQRGILDISNDARSWTPASGTTSYQLNCDDSQKTVETNTQKFGVFGRSEGSDAAPDSGFNNLNVYQMRLYSLKFEEKGEIIHDYRVAKKSNGTVGLLDIKTDIFFAKQGTDDFGGLEIEVPCPVSVNADVSAAYQLPELEKTHVPNFAPGANRMASYFKTDEASTTSILTTLEGSYTMSAWIRVYSGTTSGVGNLAIMGSGSQGTKGVLLFIKNNDKTAPDDGTLRVQWNINGSQELLADTTNKNLKDSKWHHVATTFDNTGDGTFKLYLDGIKVGEAVRSTVTGQLELQWPFAIGGREYRDNNNKLIGNMPFDGNIVEASLWNRALTDAEVAEIKVCRPSKRKAGLVSFWPLWTDKDDSTADEGIDLKKAYPLTNTQGPDMSAPVSYVDRDDFPFDYGYLFGKLYGLSIIVR